MTPGSTETSPLEVSLAETPLVFGRERAFLSLAEPVGLPMTNVTFLPVVNERLAWHARTGVVEGPAPTIEDLIRSLDVAYALIERPGKTVMPLRYMKVAFLLALGLAASIVVFFDSPSLGLSPVYGVLGAVGFLGLMLVVYVARATTPSTANGRGDDRCAETPCRGAQPLVRIEMKTEPGRVNMVVLIILALIILSEAVGGVVTALARAILAGFGRDAQAVPQGNLLIMLLILAVVGVLCVVI